MVLRSRFELLSEHRCSLAPADAAATGAYNPHNVDWDSQLLAIVSDDHEALLRRMLAPVEALDVPKECASSWLVRRYGFAEGEAPVRND